MNRGGAKGGKGRAMLFIDAIIHRLVVDPIDKLARRLPLWACAALFVAAPVAAIFALIWLAT
jgi:hypothetical protein